MSNIQKSVEQMTQAHLRNVQQLAVFYTGSNNVYAINITKIKAFIITEEVSLTSTPTDTDVIAAVATIRGEPITIINLDKWLGLPSLDISEYTLIVYCEFNHKKIGFLVKSMIDIIEKSTDDLKHTEEQNSKITYTTYVDIDNKTELCSVFNAEQLLKDIGWTKEDQESLDNVAFEPFNHDKLVLVAEDSNVAREILIQFLKKTKLRYQIFNNGVGLLHALETLSPDEVGLVITDLEMPEVDGFQVLQYVKSGKFSNVPVIVNSSMTTKAVKDKVESLGVDGFVGKTDIELLYSTVKGVLEKA